MVRFSRKDVLILSQHFPNNFWMQTSIEGANAWMQDMVEILTASEKTKKSNSVMDFMDGI